MSFKSIAMSEMNQNDMPPPTQLKRQITGEHVEKENVHAIQMFGLSAFIQENMSGFYTEQNAALHVYLNNPVYIKAQQVYLDRTRRT